jgi:hypothetical protein
VITIELTREELHKLVQRIADPSILPLSILDAMRVNEVGPWEHADLFQDMFGPPQEPAWERSTDEHGGRIFCKKDKK